MSTETIHLPSSRRTIPNESLFSIRFLLGITAWTSIATALATAQHYGLAYVFIIVSSFFMLAFNVATEPYFRSFGYHLMCTGILFFAVTVLCGGCLLMAGQAGDSLVIIAIAIGGAIAGFILLPVAIISVAFRYAFRHKQWQPVGLFGFTIWIFSVAIFFPLALPYFLHF